MAANLIIFTGDRRCERSEPHWAWSETILYFFDFIKFIVGFRSSTQPTKTASDRGTESEYFQSLRSLGESITPATVIARRRALTPTRQSRWLRHECFHSGKGPWSTFSSFAWADFPVSHPGRFNHRQPTAGVGWGSRHETQQFIHYIQYVPSLAPGGKMVNIRFPGGEGDNDQPFTVSRRESDYLN